MPVPTVKFFAKHTCTLHKLPGRAIPATLVVKQNEMLSESFWTLFSGHGMKAKLTNIAAHILMAMAVSAASLSAQEGRKVISNPVPVYPQLARNNHIAGTVKVQVVIAPDGHIKSTQVIGGHPLLADAVKDTLKDWKYAPASTESTAILEFQFKQ